MNGRGANCGEPSQEDALMVAVARRDYPGSERTWPDLPLRDLVLRVEGVALTERVGSDRLRWSGSAAAVATIAPLLVVPTIAPNLLERPSALVLYASVIVVN